MMDQNSILPIFIVEDDPILRDSLATIFDIQGYSVKVFGDASLALASFLKGAIPGVIIMDGDLPGMAGPEAIRAIRKAGFEGAFIGISAGDYRDEMLDAGAVFYWEKPFEIPGFMQSVEGLVKKNL